MKTILFLLIPIIMMGQDSTNITDYVKSSTGFTIPNEPKYEFNNPRYIFDVSGDFFIVDDLRNFDGRFGDYISLMLLESLEEYEAECYADSTKSFKVIGILSSESNPYPTYQYDTVWIHRESGIPKGFIEFLRSKK